MRQDDEKDKIVVKPPKPKRPRNYHLVKLRVYDPVFKVEKLISGWWTGKEWMGVHLRERHQIISFIRKRQCKYGLYEYFL